MIKINYNKINCFFLLVFFVIQSMDNAFRELNFNITLLKNIILFIFLLICIIETKTIIKNKNCKFSNQLYRVIFICFVFLILSAYFAYKQSFFSSVTIIALLKLFIPAFIAYVILNTVNFKNINLLMKLLLVLSAVLYFIIILPNINITNIKSISFINSNSVFESNFFSPISLGLFMYFFYFEEKKWPIYLSFIMILLNFKRPMILIAIISLLFSKYLKSDKNISKNIIYCLIIFFSLSVYLYITALKGTYDEILIKYFGIGINKLTMGRAWLLEYTFSHYKSSGFGTSTLNGRTIEMDLIMYYLEMGILSVITYVYNYYFMCERKIYNVWMVTGVLLICLTSHFYDISFFWILFYITMGLVIIKSNDKKSSNDNYFNINEGVK